MARSFHIGEACAFADGPAVAPISSGQRERVAQLGWRFTSLDAALSPARQAAQLERLLELDVDAVTAFALDPDLAEPALARAAAAGIPVVTFGCESPSAVTTISQGVDSAAPAGDAAAYIAARIAGARVLVIGGPPVPALTARTELFLIEAARAGLELVAREDNVGDIDETARPIVARLLDEHAGVDAIWCFNDYTALAAANVLRERGMPVWSGPRNGAIVVGLGGFPEAIAAIRAGRMTLSYDSQPIETGRAAVDVLAQALLCDGDPPRELWIDCVRYDASNIDSFVPWDAR